MQRFKKLYMNQFSSNVRVDILAGITVALALIPEAIAFSIIVGVNPMVGLYASFCIAIVIAIAGGRTGMISAATGAMALLMVDLVKDHGLQYLFAATILAGVIQVILGIAKVGRFLSFIPHSVMLGFVNALAILIFLAQIPQFVGASWVMYLMVGLTLAIIYFLPRWTTAVPAPLVAIIIMTIASISMGLGLKTVGDMGNIQQTLPVFSFPMVPITFDMLMVILPYSLSLALVGILESLLTARLLDDLTDTKSDKNREVRGQGIANVVSGFFGGMAGCAMIGQSMINYQSGGRGRLSTLTSGVCLILLILVLGSWVKQIPMAALVGVMIMVSISTFDWQSVRDIKKIPLSDSLIMLVTVAVVVGTHDLSKGVLVGVLMSAVVFGWKISRIRVHAVEENDTTKTYLVSGPLFFGSASHFQDEFQYTDPHQAIVIDLTDSHIWDHSGVHAISKVMHKYQQLNKQVIMQGLNSESETLINKIGYSVPSSH